MDICADERPPIVEAAPGHEVACHLYSEGSTEPLRV
jgi:hypothetical protein